MGSHGAGKHRMSSYSGGQGEGQPVTGNGRKGKGRTPRITEVQQTGNNGKKLSWSDKFWGRK